jgi:diguanylate cyclase (GGDEF)-like protein
MSVIAIDIDHFKRVNDSFGHPAGDAVLIEVGRRILSALRSSDVLARTGGEEFLVLAHDTETEAALEVAERIRHAVSASPTGLTPASGLASDRVPNVSMTVSIGLATLEEEDTFDRLARRADRALYAAKEGGRDRVMTSHISDAVALEVDPAVLAVLERVADIVDRRLSPDEHSSLVATWSAHVARSLGLTALQEAEIALAGRLHDIGKINIPDSILQKREGLDADEWLLIRTHPEAGADMLLGLVPQSVAAIVARHHEHYDGSGYPDRLAAHDIPIGARIIAVTDAYAAMTARRYYGTQQTHEQADAELDRCAGTQFDPTVVEAFRAMLVDQGIDSALTATARRS